MAAFVFLFLLITIEVVLVKIATAEHDRLDDDEIVSRAILTGYPPYEYRTVSLGCFIEHDTAEARMKTTADVIQTKSGKGCNWSDVGYVIPQTTVQDSILQDLVHQLSGPLLQEQYIGFFGIDIVLFRDDTGAMDYWVVDIDPYYTDLLSFDDWRRFCLNIPFSTSPELFTSQNNDGSADALANKDHRYVVCSGKLYTGGSISSETLIDLYKKNKLAYSYKAKSGCMICPINNEKTSFLLFSIYRSRDLALRYFIRGLKALKSVTDQAKKSDKYGMDSNITNLLISVKKSFGVVD